MSAGTKRASSRAPLTIAAVMALGTAIVTPVSAIADDPASDTADTVDHLTTGYWNGTAFAAGGATGVIEGMDTTLGAGINATFDFLAVEDGASPGSVSGTWSHSGNGFLTFDGIVEGQAVTGSGDLAFGGSQGSMSGDTRLIELRGDSRTTGTLTASAMGQSTSMPVDNVSPLPTLEVRVLGGTCEVVHGDWVYSIESEVASQGLSANFSGRWTAWRDNTQNFDDDIEALRDSVTGQLELQSDDLALAGSPALDEAADLFVEYADFAASGHDWDIDSVISLLHDAERILMDLRDGSDCERVFLGDSVEEFDTLLMGLIQEMIRYAVDFAEPSVWQWTLMANIAVRTGAIGSGSPDPVGAAEVESRMIAYAEAVLESVLDDDGWLPVTDEVTRLVGTSAMMGWDLTIDGRTASAQQWWVDLEGN